ncbi:unnamed protein product, partial [Ectocarpus sp. 12 AP-2014]
RTHRTPTTRPLLSAIRPCSYHTPHGCSPLGFSPLRIKDCGEVGTYQVVAGKHKALSHKIARGLRLPCCIVLPQRSGSQPSA